MHDLCTRIHHFPCIGREYRVSINDKLLGERMGIPQKIMISAKLVYYSESEGSELCIF